MYKKYIKRVLSVIASIFGLIILFPLMLVIAIIIKGDSKGNAIYKQIRLGMNQKEFTVYKFRTMVENAYEIGGIATHEGDARITRVGAFLRKTSLDEIPQLFNILKGEMSIIGPRPILKEEFEPYRSNMYYTKRYDVRPGLFCTVDMDYRAAASRETQFDMDVKYIENISVMLDIKVFFKTFIMVLKRKNVYKHVQANKTIGS